MNIRLLITVFCFALIQFQGRAAAMTGSYTISNREVGAQTVLTVAYTIVTPSPDYILYLPTISPFTFLSTLSVVINNSQVAFTETTLGLIKLQNPALAVAGSKITVYISIRNPNTIGVYQFEKIKTATSNGVTIDYVDGSTDSFTIVPLQVVFLPTTAITTSGFTVNWNPSIGATNYYLEVSTNYNFMPALTGFSGLNIGNVTSYTMTGLLPNTTYYLRLKTGVDYIGEVPGSRIEETTWNPNLTTATVSLSNLSATFNGMPHPAAATTNPAGLTVDITYNGSSAVPINPGTYAVVGKINSTTYQGSTTGSLIISKATVTPVLSKLSVFYDGNLHAATVTTNPSGLTVNITYNGSSTVPINPGTYVVVATINNPVYQGSKTGNLVISKGIANPVLNNLTATYDGSAHAATATTTPSGLAVGIAYNGLSTVPTNAGTYAVIATVSDANYQGTATGSLVISKAISNVVLNNLTATYDGSAHAATATTTPSGLTVGITYNGLSTVPINAGTYAVVATVSDANYQGSATGSLVISKVTANPVLSNLSAVYDGSPKVFVATTNPSGLNVIKTYNGFSSIPTNVGTYAVVATVSDVNYQGSATGSLVISKATSNPVLSNLTATYNGSTHAATATTSLSGLTVGITYNGSSTVPTNAGTYAVVATVNDANYQGTATGSLVISKATSNPVLSNLNVIYTGSVHAATATTTPVGLNVAITYDGSPTIPVEVGTYNVVATVNDVNYQGSSTATLTISSIATGVTGKVLTDINMYPNPCKEFVRIDAHISIITTIRIVNVEGITVMQKEDCLQQERIDVTSLAKGVYMVIVDAETGRGTYRLIVY